MWLKSLVIYWPGHVCKRRTFGNKQQHLLNVFQSVVEMIFLSSETKYDPVTVTGGTLCCDDGTMVWRYKVDSYINLDLVISYNLMLKVLGFFHNINRQQQQVKC